MRVVFGFVYKAGPTKTKQVIMLVAVNDKTIHSLRYRDWTGVVAKFSKLQYYLSVDDMSTQVVFNYIVVCNSKSSRGITVYLIVS